MSVRVNAAWHDVCAFRIDDFIALEPFSDGGNTLAFDEDFCRVGSICGHDSTALDDSRHNLLPSVQISGGAIAPLRSTISL